MRADLVVRNGDETLVVVEAKAHPVDNDFRSAVMEQIRDYAVATRARWAILADPEAVQVYHVDDFERPVASFPTEELRKGSLPTPMGEHTVLLAVENWLRRLSVNGDVVQAKPQLKPLAASLANADQYSLEYGLD